MIRFLRSYLRRLVFRWATRHLDAAIAHARAKHGRVREAQEAKSAAVHAALRQAVKPS